MDLLLEEGGAVTGQEKGRTMRSRKCVDGVIPQGKWGVNGKLEFDYVFQDGTVFVYTGDIDLGLGRYAEPCPFAVKFHLLLRLTVVSMPWL
jgi:hypothetical protein